VAIKPDWSKGYGRKGTALYGLKRFREAEKAYNDGLAIDPTNEQLKKGLAEMKDSVSSSGLNIISQFFKDPAVVERLKEDPTTSSFFSQPDFLEIFSQIQANPKALEQCVPTLFAVGT